jgi:phytanoyl-CoA hydroxylase
MRKHNNPECDREEEAYGFPYPLSDAVSVELEPGSAVFFNGYLLHASYPNKTERGFRRALLYAYTSASTPMAFHPRSVPVSNYSDYRDIVMVRGNDPYAWKGIEDLGRAYLRKPGPTLVDKVLARRNPVSGETSQEDQQVLAAFIAPN